VSDDAHATLAPSSSGRWANCAGSVALLRQYGLPDTPSDSAAEGTAAHWVGAMGLKGQPQPVGTITPDGYIVTQDLKDGAQVFVDHVESHGILASVETRVTMTSIHALCWGTCDAFAIDLLKKVVYVDDLKFGYGLVEPFELDQLICYANGVYEILEGNGEDPNDYRWELTIVQPRVWHRSGAVRTWKVSTPELRNHFRRLREAAEEAMGNNPRTRPGPWCKHCPARHVCPALRATTLGLVDMVSDITPVEISPKGLAVELHILSQAKARLEARLSGLEAQAAAWIRQGTDVPSWMIDHTAGREEWTKPVAEVLALGQMYGASLAKELEPITPAQARKKGVPAEIIKLFSTRKPGNAKLVRVSTTDARRVFGGQT
jgi:hypothetical protein